MSTGTVHHVSMKCGNMWSHPNIEFHPFYGRQNFGPSWPSYLTLILHRVIYMTDYFLNVPSQKFPVPKINMQTKSHSLKFNVLSSVIDSSGVEVSV